MRYEVWKWTLDDMKQYDDDYGEGAYEREFQHPGCYASVIQYGTLVKKTDNEIEATKICDDFFQTNSGFFSGDIAVWDNVEHFWFN